MIYEIRPARHNVSCWEPKMKSLCQWVLGHDVLPVKSPAFGDCSCHGFGKSSVFDIAENRFLEENCFSRHGCLSFNAKVHFVTFLCMITLELLLQRNTESKPWFCVHFLEDKLREK